MRRLWIIVAALVIVPIVEIAVLIGVGEVIGFWPTLLLVLATSFLGGWLLRREGAKAWRTFQTDLAERRPPGRAGTDGLLVLIGGIFMLLPGFVSDVIGLFFILPPTRRAARALLLTVAETRMSSAASSALFGPRQVRVNYGAPQHAGTSPAAGDEAPIEGEILDP